MMKVIILDPVAIKFSSHHFTYNRAICEELAARGIGSSLYVTADCDPAMAGHLPIKPCFAIETYAYPDVPDRQTMLDKISMISMTAERDLRERFSDTVGGDDLILFHSATVFQLLGVYNWYETLPEPRPRVVFQFLVPPWFFGVKTDKDYCCSLLADIMRMWLSRHGERVRFGAENPILGRLLAEQAGAEISLFPMSIRFPEWTPPKPAPQTGGTVRLAYMGDARVDKGLNALFEAVERHSGRIPGHVQMVIQVSDHQPVRYQSFGPRGEHQLLVGALSRDEYWRTIASCDALVLPYNPEAYDVRGSGILFDGIGMGKPLLVTAGSCLGPLMEPYGAPGVVVDYTPPDIARGIAVLADNIATYHDDALRASLLVRGHHAPARFVDAVLGTAPVVLRPDGAA